MQRCNDVALSELLEWYFSWGGLTHLWDSQQFVAFGTPWKNRHICWIAAHTVLVSVFVDRVCVCVFILDCMWFRFLARASCFVAALCKFSRVQEVLCCWPPTLKKRMQRKVIRDIDSDLFILYTLFIWPTEVSQPKMRKTANYCCWLCRQRRCFVCMCYWVVHACRVGAFWAKWNHSILFYLDDVVLSIVTLPLASRLDAWLYHYLGTTHRIPIFWHFLCTHSIPSATMHGYLDIKVFESWAMKPFRVLDYPMSVWILQGLALLTVSLCSDHYQLSCPSRFLSFFSPCVKWALRSRMSHSV